MVNTWHIICSNWKQFHHCQKQFLKYLQKKPMILDGEPERKFIRRIADDRRRIIIMVNHPNRLLPLFLLGQWNCGRFKVINRHTRPRWGSKQGSQKWLNDKLICQSNHLGLYKITQTRTKQRSTGTEYQNKNPRTEQCKRTKNNNG